MEYSCRENVRQRQIIIGITKIIKTVIMTVYVPMFKIWNRIRIISYYYRIYFLRGHFLFFNSTLYYWSTIENTQPSQPVIFIIKHARLIYFQYFLFFTRLKLVLRWLSCSKDDGQTRVQTSNAVYLIYVLLHLLTEYQIKSIHKLYHIILAQTLRFVKYFRSVWKSRL